MKFLRLLMVSTTTSALALIPSLSRSQDLSNFARDRTIAVMDRVPQGYAPLGFRAGLFTLSPTLDFGLTANDNVFYTRTDKVSDFILDVSPAISARSDWERNALGVALSADYSNYASRTSENVLQWTSSVDGRYDIHGNSNLFGGASFSQDYEPRSDPSAPENAATPVKYDATTATLGTVLEGNRLKLKVSLNYLNYNYFDVLSTTGQMIDQTDRDFAETSLAGRGDYAISPDASVFLAYDTNERTYKTDTRRDSHGYDAGVGASFDLTNLITGDIQVGYLEQTYRDTTFKPTGSTAFHVRVQYFPTQLMTISLVANRTIEETPAQLASGYLSTAGTLSVDHELLRNLVLSAGVNYEDDTYNGIDRQDRISGLTLGARYLMSRNVIVKLGYTYSENQSRGTAAINSYKDNAVRLSLGLRY